LLDSFFLSFSQIITLNAYSACIAQSNDEWNDHSGLASGAFHPIDFIVAFSLTDLEREFELLLPFKGGYYERGLGAEFTLVFRIHFPHSLTCFRC
jgi:hypothetical protein